MDASEISKLQRTYRRRFDEVEHQRFHGRGYSNFGFWTSTTTMGQHGDHLVDRLMEFLPNASGEVLDVACGQGGTTKRLTKYFPPSSITAINLFEDQLEAAREFAPECRFLQMDAAKMTFEDESFDFVLCVEAAFRFDTREAFLHEAHRALRPGGALVMADVLLHKAAPGIPKQNLTSREEYDQLFEAGGFSSPAIVSVRDQTWEPFRHQFLQHLVDLESMELAEEWREQSRLWDQAFIDYLLVCVRKPERNHFMVSASPASKSTMGS